MSNGLSLNKVKGIAFNIFPLEVREACKCTSFVFRKLSRMHTPPLGQLQDFTEANACVYGSIEKPEHINTLLMDYPRIESVPGWMNSV